MRTSALVLAAGSARRFGGEKLTTRFRGRALIVHCFGAVRQAIQEDVVQEGLVVCRANDQVVLELAVAHDLYPVPVRLAGGGLAESLRAGISALASGSEPASDGVLIIPGDQPLVRVEVMRTLVHEAGEGSVMIRPIYQDEPEVPGHPVWLARSVWPLVQELREDEGFARVLAERGLPIKTVAVAGRNPDVDTRERLGSLETEP